MFMNGGDPSEKDENTNLIESHVTQAASPMSVPFLSFSATGRRRYL